ncbi:MAG: hypothetical protein MMC33_005588 [Icmadophila ericetorum]|nr:hypothetical protein [Icmadophila ericetorum]
MENIFINALVKASTCHEHGGTTPPSRTGFHHSHKLRQKSSDLPPKPARRFHCPSKSTQQVVAPQAINRNEYLHMIDYYSSTTVEDGRTNHEPQLSAVRIVPHQTSPEEPLQDRDKRDIIESAGRIIMEEESSYEDIYKAYLTLPFPGVHYLAPAERNKLLQRLAVGERKNEQVLLRYLAVMDDMKAANLPLHGGQWNSAIYLVGRSFPKVTAVQVESALRMWREMEEDAGVPSTSVTYNILFHVASRAKKYALAEMILKEIKTRGKGLNRYAHVDLIYFYGLRGDSDKIRQTYREYVKSGQIVDTVVMNCVISSLLQAGEFPAADHVYQRMRNMHAKQTGSRPPPNDWKATRELGRVLYRASKYSAKDPELRHRLQDEESLAPNIQTYVILLKHHVSQTGELESVAKLVDDMRLLRLPFSGRIFVELFRGFANYGGIRYTSWNGPRLESVWNSFIELADRELKEVYIGKWSVIWVLRAYMACCGKKRTLDIWEELKSRWKPSEHDERIFLDILDRERSTPYAIKV